MIFELEDIAPQGFKKLKPIIHHVESHDNSRIL